MDRPSPCPYRYIHKGRTFCAIAIRERRFTTTEVTPSACEDCRAQEILQSVACGHLNLGVEVDHYGGSLEVNIFYASCEALLERLMAFEGCGSERCPLWRPIGEDHAASLRAEALEAHREVERRQSE